MAKNTWDSMWDSGTFAGRPAADAVAANAYYFATDTNQLWQSDGVSTWTEVYDFGGGATDPEYTTIELGHPTDTTLARASAGQVTIEGNVIYRAGGTDVPVTDGGTGASSASSARTNLGISAANTPITDSGNYYTGTDVEAALQEIGAGGIGGGGGPVVPFDHASMGATETIDLDDGTWHRGTLNANCTVTVTGFTVDEGAQILLKLTQDGTGGWTVVWDADVEFLTDDQPDPAIGSVTYFLLWSDEGDTTIYATKVGGILSAEDVPVDDSGFTEISGTDVQTVLDSIDDTIAGIVAGGGNATMDVVAVTAAGNGTWTKPTGAEQVWVTVIGGGGGGGGGRKGANGSGRWGGSGGAGGGVSRALFKASDLSSTEKYTVGAAGSSGAGATTNDTNGSNGTAGGASFFGNSSAGVGTDAKVAAGGGSAGEANSGAAFTILAPNLTASGYPTGGFGEQRGGMGATSASSATVTAGGDGGGGGAGGMGGTIRGDTDVAQPGGAGGRSGGLATYTAAAGGATSSAGTAGTAAPVTAGVAGNGGGGGGGSTTGTNGGAGGAGGAPGGGGGGGGAGLNSTNNSGAGGAGAAGLVLIVTLCIV